MNHDRNRKVPPGRVRSFHRPVSDKKVGEYTASMTTDGWEGRALLVEELPAGGYQAWTGNHRIAAAKSAALHEIPVFLVDVEALLANGYKRNSTWGSFEAIFSYPDEENEANNFLEADDRKRDALFAAGDLESAELMTQEIEARKVEREREKNSPKLALT